MDDYDPRRLPAYQDGTLKMSAEELKSLALVDPTLSQTELAALLEDDEVLEKVTTERR